MSSPRGDPTDAPDYESLVVALSPGKRLGYDALRQVYLRLRPRRWSDRLTAEQRSLFHRVDSWGSWEEAREILDGELAEVKTLWLGAGGSGGGYLTRIYLGTYMGRACVVNVFSLRGDSGDPASAVPGDLRRWIGDEDVVKVVTDDAEELLSSPPYNLDFRCVVNAGSLYSKFRRMGVIRTPWECGGGRLEELLSASLGYHHRPCTETEWERLVGESRYNRWPAHRYPSWSPRVLDGDSHQTFFEFYEAVGSVAFTAHLIMLLIAEDRYPGLDASLPLRRFLPDFLRRQAAILPSPRARDEVVVERVVRIRTDGVRITEWAGEDSDGEEDRDTWRSAFFVDRSRSSSSLSDAPIIPPGEIEQSSPGPVQHPDD